MGFNIFNAIADSIEHLGSTIAGSAEDVQHGSFFNADYVDGMIFLDGNSKHARAALNDAGIDAWGQSRLDHKMGSLNVKPKDKGRAIRELKRKGYNCWPGRK